MSGAIHTHLSTWELWQHVCGYWLESALYYNGVQERPLWRVENPGGGFSGIHECPQCGARLYPNDYKREIR